MSLALLFHYLMLNIIMGYIHDCKHALETLKFDGFLGAFVKFRKATASFIKPVHVSSWSICTPTEQLFMKVE